MSAPISSDPKDHDPTISLEGLVDEMLARYLEWRVHARGVADAYRRWTTASRAEGVSRFSAYIAALDQEAAMAMNYASAVENVERNLQPD